MTIHIGSPSPTYDHHSEGKFAKYLDRQGIAFIYTNQSPKTFSKILKILNGKRPDFIISTDKFGLVFADSKTSKLDYTPDFTLSLEDFKKYKEVREIFKTKVYLAYPIDTKWLELWGFISLEEVDLLYKKQKFQYMPLKFIRISIHKLNQKLE